MFLVDGSTAGEGRLAVTARGQDSQVPVEIGKKSSGRHTVSLVPTESGPHKIYVLFNDSPVPG